MSKWLYVRLYTFTHPVWRQNIPLMPNYNEDLDAVVEIEERDPPEHEYVAVRFTMEPRDNEYYYELQALIPNDERFKEKLFEIWKDIISESYLGTDIAEKLLELSYMNGDDNPTIKVYDDGYEIEVSINEFYL